MDKDKGIEVNVKGVHHWLDHPDRDKLRFIDSLSKTELQDKDMLDTETTILLQGLDRF
jgi:hypothetical protein